MVDAVQLKQHRISQHHDIFGFHYHLNVIHSATYCNIFLLCEIFDVFRRRDERVSMFKMQVYIPVWLV